jgi:hypothetical protein
LIFIKRKNNQSAKVSLDFPAQEIKEIKTSLPARAL